MSRRQPAAASSQARRNVPVQLLKRQARGVVRVDFVDGILEHLRSAAVSVASPIAAANPRLEGSRTRRPCLPRLLSKLEVAKVSKALFNLLPQHGPACPRHEARQQQAAAAAARLRRKLEPERCWLKDASSEQSWELH